MKNPYQFQPSFAELATNQASCHRPQPHLRHQLVSRVNQTSMLVMTQNALGALRDGSLAFPLQVLSSIHQSCTFKETSYENIDHRPSLALFTTGVVVPPLGRLVDSGSGRSSLVVSFNLLDSPIQVL